MGVTYPESASGQQEKVEIYTLGRFLIKRGDMVLSDDSGRSKKVWELFKYLISHRDKAFPPEEILETLWPNREYSDSNLAVRSLVYRLRHLLGDRIEMPDLALNVVSSHGCYKWETVTGCRFDIDEFERLCRQAEQSSREDTGEAITTYQAALYLYKGEFLPECSYHKWVIPIRSYYHRLYLQSVMCLLDLLKDARRFPEMITACENALMIEHFTEAIHLRYLEALLAEKKYKQARAHYEAVTDAFYREMGAKPSAGMREIYRLIKSEDSDSFSLNLSFIQEQLLIRQESGGAYICDPDMFRHIFNLERQKRERTGGDAFLGLLAITADGYRKPPGETTKEAMADLHDVLRSSLRRGDVISHWNEAQFLVMLAGLNKQQAEKVLERIEIGFRERSKCTGIVLHKKLQAFISAVSA